MRNQVYHSPHGLACFEGDYSPLLINLDSVLWFVGMVNKICKRMDFGSNLFSQYANRLYAKFCWYCKLPTLACTKWFALAIVSLTSWSSLYLKVITQRSWLLGMAFLIERNFNEICRIANFDSNPLVDYVKFSTLWKFFAIPRQYIVLYEANFGSNSVFTLVDTFAAYWLKNRMVNRICGSLLKSNENDKK